MSAPAGRAGTCSGCRGAGDVRWLGIALAGTDGAAEAEAEADAMVVYVSEEVRGEG